MARRAMPNRFILTFVTLAQMRGSLGFRIMHANKSFSRSVAHRGGMGSGSCDGLSTKVLVYNVEKDGREEEGQKPIKDAAAFIFEGMLDKGVNFISVPEASFELLRQLWTLIRTKPAPSGEPSPLDSIGVLYEVVYSEWAIGDSTISADLGLAILFRKDRWTLEKRSKCSEDGERAADFKPYSGSDEEESDFQDWVTESCSNEAKGEHITLSLNKPPFRPMIAARFMPTVDVMPLEKVFVLSVHGGHTTHTVGKNGAASDAEQIAKGLATVHDGTASSAYWLFGDMNTHFGLHNHSQKTEELLPLIDPKNTTGLEGFTFDLKNLQNVINNELDVSYELFDTLPEGVEEPATCCCPPGLPWKRVPNRGSISTGCAGGSNEAEVDWTPTTDWRALFKSSADRCQSAQEAFLPDMPNKTHRKTSYVPHRCLPSYPIGGADGVDESLIYEESGVSTVKQYSLDHVLVGVPANFALNLKAYGLIDVNFKASDHFPIMSDFEICAATPNLD